MSQSDSDPRDLEDRFTIHPSRYGAMVRPSVRAEVHVEMAEIRPRVTVRFRGKKWVFKRDRRGLLAKQEGPEVPSWIKTALRTAGVGEVAA